MQRLLWYILRLRIDRCSKALRGFDLNQSLNGRYNTTIILSDRNQHCLLEVVECSQISNVFRVELCSTCIYL